MYTLARAVLWPLSKLLFRLSVSGRDKIPASGAVILVANHTSYIDPVLVGVASKRPIHYMAKSELWSVPVLGWLITRLNAFPVRRGTADRNVIRIALDLLARDQIVLLFPEGTRHRESGLGEIQAGAGVIAQKAHVPIVPVAVSGTERIFPRDRRFPRFPKLKVVVGDALMPSAPASSTPEAKRLGLALIERAMAQIGRMLAEAERGQKVGATGRAGEGA